MALGLVRLSGPEQSMHLRDMGSQVLDLDGPLVHQLPDHLAAHADLDAIVVERRATQAALGIPLNVDLGLLEGIMPLGR